MAGWVRGESCVLQQVSHIGTVTVRATKWEQQLNQQGLTMHHNTTKQELLFQSEQNAASQAKCGQPAANAPRHVALLHVNCNCWSTTWGCWWPLRLVCKCEAVSWLSASRLNGMTGLLPARQLAASQHGVQWRPLPVWRAMEAPPSMACKGDPGSALSAHQQVVKAPCQQVVKGLRPSWAR